MRKVRKGYNLKIIALLFVILFMPTSALYSFEREQATLRKPLSANLGGDIERLKKPTKVIASNSTLEFSNGDINIPDFYKQEVIFAKREIEQSYFTTLENGIIGCLKISTDLGPEFKGAIDCLLWNAFIYSFPIEPIEVEVASFKNSTDIQTGEIIKVSIRQKSSRQFHWDKLKKTKDRFDEIGHNYLTNITERGNDEVILGGGAGFLLISDLMDKTVVNLTYKRNPIQPFCIETNLYIKLPQKMANPQGTLKIEQHTRKEL